MAGLARATDVWRRRDDVLSRETPRSRLVLTPTAPAPLVLEGAAAFVWDELAVARTRDQLVASLARRLGQPRDDVRPHVLTACSALSEQGAIVGGDA